MDLLIQGRNFQVNDRTREYISKKVLRLERHLPSIDQIRVDFSEEDTRSQEHRVLAKATVSVKGVIILTGEERAANAFAAIDTLIDNLDRRVKRHKGKTYRSEQAKKGRVASPRFVPPEETVEED